MASRHDQLFPFSTDIVIKRENQVKIQTDIQLIILPFYVMIMITIDTSPCMTLATLVTLCVVN